MKVLVAFGSKYGATREIAERIGETIQVRGLPVDVVSCDQVKDLSPYSAVILGSAVYVGQWQPDAAQFLKDNEKKLSELPTWIFSSGPTGEGDPIDLLKGWRFPEALQPVADRIKPREITCFSGKLDLKKLNLIEKTMIKMVKASAGDFRNWSAIEDWTATIAETLLKEASSI